MSLHYGVSLDWIFKAESFLTLTLLSTLGILVPSQVLKIIEHAEQHYCLQNPPQGCSMFTLFTAPE